MSDPRRKRLRSRGLIARSADVLRHSLSSTLHPRFLHPPLHPRPFSLRSARGRIRLGEQNRADNRLRLLPATAKRRLRDLDSAEILGMAPSSPLWSGELTARQKGCAG